MYTLHLRAAGESPETHSGDEVLERWPWSKAQANSIVCPSEQSLNCWIAQSQCWWLWSRMARASSACSLVSILQVQWGKHMGKPWSHHKLWPEYSVDAKQCQIRLRLISNIIEISSRNTPSPSCVCDANRWYLRAQMRSFFWSACSSKLTFDDVHILCSLPNHHSSQSSCVLTLRP